MATMWQRCEGPTWTFFSLAVFTYVAMQGVAAPAGGAHGDDGTLFAREHVVPPVSGSGFVVWPDGHILTAAHVVASACRVEVQLDGRRYLAGVVKADDTSDLALLKIDAANLPIGKLGNSNTVARLDPIWVLGFPFSDQGGQPLSTTAGYVTALHSQAPRPLIQVDAAVNPGNSGSPLLNDKGEVIGLITSKFLAKDAGFTVSERLNYAVPIRSAIPLLAAIQDYDFSLLGRASARLSPHTIDREGARFTVQIRATPTPPPLTVARMPQQPGNSESDGDSNAKFKGPVRSITVRRAYLFGNDEALEESKARLDSAYLYDRMGREIELRYYGLSEELIRKVLTLYDDRGNVIKRHAFFPNLSDPKCADMLNRVDCRLHSTVTVWDSEGKKLEERYLDHGQNLENGKRLRYDSAGNVVEEEGYDAEGRVTWRFVHRYSCRPSEVEEVILRYPSGQAPAGEKYGTIVHTFKDGRKVKEENRTAYTFTKEFKYDEKGSLVGWRDISYEDGRARRVEDHDAQGRKTGQILYDGDGRILGQTANSYNELGQVSRETSYAPDGSIIRVTEYRYDGLQRLLAVTISDEPGHTRPVMDMRYNDRGDLVEMITYSEDGSAKSHDHITYKYDLYGNWIRMRSSGGSFTYRSITYYP